MDLAPASLPRRLGVFLITAAAMVASADASALPINATLFCGVYPAAPACSTGRASCATCHEGGPPALNPFGADVRREISTRPDYAARPEDFQRYLPEVLTILEDRDSDGDGVSNMAEIMRGHGPGEASDRPGDEDPGAYDQALAWKRLNVTYCGQSPTYEQNQAFQQASDKRAALHTALDTCLTSDFWLKEALPRLGDERIRPTGSLGPDGNPFILGDYGYDYRLFTYALSGSRDARDLLVADYHIAADGSVVHGTIPDHRVPGRYVIGNGQPLQPERRAGMITTQWFISTNTMFALMPRTTAAQAYRAYLGLDIAKSEGLNPVPGEPRDVDHMHVDMPDCAVCHSTLDPLAYPFSPYVALNRKRPDGTNHPRDVAVGGYDAGGTTWEGQGYLFGQPVRDLLDWARKAADSDAFKVNLASVFYRQALGRLPATSIEQQEFAALWQALPADGYQANKLIHRLIDTRSFGAPGPASAPYVAWKRHKAVAHDLARVLALPAQDVCREFGMFSCTDEVFLAPLGGNDPFTKSQYKPAAAPTATTPIALERVVLGACGKRVDTDAQGSPAVFRFFDLARPSLVDVPDAVDQQTKELYRRFLGRDPSQSETALMRELTVDDAGRPVAAREVAKLACFTLGTSQEFAFN